MWCENTLAFNVWVVYKIFCFCPTPPFSSLPSKMMLFVLADRGLDLEMKDCREWVKSKLQERGNKPFAFVRTAPCYDPSRPNADGTFPGNSSFTL